VPAPSNHSGVVFAHLGGILPGRSSRPRRAPRITAGKKTGVGAQVLDHRDSLSAGQMTGVAEAAVPDDREPPGKWIHLAPPQFGDLGSSAIPYRCRPLLYSR
jgi:hypothetical protein